MQDRHPKPKHKRPLRSEVDCPSRAESPDLAQLVRLLARQTVREAMVNGRRQVLKPNADEAN